MCDCLDGKFVVPKEQKLGVASWWIGQVLRDHGNSYEINILWVRDPRYAHDQVVTLPKSDVIEFESEARAMSYLRKIGKKGEKHMEATTVSSTGTSVSSKFGKAVEALKQSATVDEAYARRRLAEIKTEVAPGFTASRAEAGERGRVFLEIGPNSGVTISIRTSTLDNLIRVSIVASVGLYPSPTGEVMLWTMPEQRWPSKAIFDAFQRWKSGGASNVLAVADLASQPVA